jgi:glutamine amidotransferase
MLAIVDYGVGNLFSLECSLSAIGVQSVVTADPNVLEKADQIILPGVGAFGDAVAKLRATGLDKKLISLAKAGKPLMGICLGMQLLFEKGFEFGEYNGLGLIKGTVGPLSEVIPPNYKIPHIGWNSLQIKQKSPLFSCVKEGDFVYFVHSFCAARCEESVVATTEYGAEVTAIVASGNVFGCQFHPEKSGEVGLKILKAFSEMEVPQC